MTFDRRQIVAGLAGLPLAAGSASAQSGWQARLPEIVVAVVAPRLIA